MEGVFKIDGVTRDGDCMGVLVLSNTCPVCKQVVVPPSMVLSAPYYCMVHKKCMPHFPFDGTYPHDRAINVMLAAPRPQVPTYGFLPTER